MRVHLTMKLAQKGWTYRAKRDRCCSQANQASISSMWLMNRISIIITQLVKDIFNALERSGSNKVSYYLLKSRVYNESKQHVW